MFTKWKSHCYQGSCKFAREGTRFQISSQTANGRGSWYAFYDEPVAGGDRFIVYGRVSGPGTIKVLCYAGDELIESIPVTHEQSFCAHERTDRMRLDLRLWNRKGMAVFQDIAIIPQSKPAVPPRGLPLPPPDTTQKHHVSGWKWGRNIALMVHDEAPHTPITYVDGSEDPIPYEVRGFQHGRRLDLEIGHMYFDEEE
jgi:hypothetical protein